MRAYQEMLYGVSRNDDSTKERWRRLIPQRAITAVRSELGVVLFVARMPARCRNGLLLFRSHLRDHRLRRCSSGEAVAAARADRGLNGHPHVRFVRGLPLRGLEPRLSIAARRSPRRLHHK